MEFATFEDRRQSRPQEVIDDLLGPIARQARAIHDKNKALGLAEGDAVEPAAKYSRREATP